MKLTRLFPIAAALLTALTLAAAPIELAKQLGMEQKVYTSPDGGALPYCRRQIGDWSNPEKKAAAVLFLHGAGERGSDNQKQLTLGARELTDYCEQNNVKALLLFPQCPEGVLWMNLPDLQKAKRFELQPQTPQLKQALELLDRELQTPGVDPDRVYLVGVSMGGFGSWEAASRHPEKFAAAFPVCGGGDPAFAPRLKQLPLLVYHGSQDKVVPPQFSRDMVKALRAAGSHHVRYVEVDRGHDSWVPAFADQANWRWLFKQQRAKSPLTTKQGE